MTQLNVYIITDDKREREVRELTKLFQDDIYYVEEAKVPPLAKEVDDDIYEIYQVQWCLEQSRRNNSNMPILILRDTSISLIGADKLKSLLGSIIEHDNNYDIFYLCRWNDDCQKYTDIGEYSDNIKIARTYGAKGTQALYFTPRGRDIFLGNEVMNNDKYLKFKKNVNRKIAKQLNNGNITAYCTLHNIFQFDITQAIRNSDFNKISPCTIMLKKGSNDNNGGTNLGYLWFVIIVILILILAFAVARIGK